MSRNTLINIAMFVAGGAIGSLVTWQLLEKKIESKYREIADQEIESVIESFSDKQAEEEEVADNEPDFKKQLANKPSINDYAKLLQDADYMNYASTTATDENKGVDDMEKPYSISPSQFGEGEYETETLYYFEGDGVLADDQYNAIENVGGLVGEGFADLFGVYEEDTVYVRNDRLQIDYEILLDGRSFSGDVDYNPRSSEDE